MNASRASDPFALLLNPEVVVKAVESSERLARLHSRVCRPLDRAILPAHKDEALAAFDAAIERASARRTPVDG